MERTVTVACLSVTRGIVRGLRPAQQCTALCSSIFSSLCYGYLQFTIYLFAQDEHSGFGYCMQLPFGPREHGNSGSILVSRFGCAIRTGVWEEELYLRG